TFNPCPQYPSFLPCGGSTATMVLRATIRDLHRPCPLSQQAFTGKVRTDRSMLDHGTELSELCEEVGKGLAHARRVSQADSRHAEPNHRKAHCDAVIAVGLDLCPVQRARIDPERVTNLLHVGTASRQFGTQGFDTLALLNP